MEEDDIAAAMGFSSFGGTKKRKFDDTSSPKAKLEGSGANSTKLGVRPKVQSSEQMGIDSQQEQDVPGNELDDVVPTTEKAQTNRKGKQKQPAATGLADFLNRGQNLPEKPNEPPITPQTAPETTTDDQSEMVSFGGPPISRAQLNALRQGVRDENGDVAYFQPSFIEDPWERLEKSQT